jgi:hypothetical protein
MPAQDDARENRIVDLFNLERPPNWARHGTDAILRIDGYTLEFELKSVTKKSGDLSSVRDFGPDHIAKWKEKHWLIAIYKENVIAHCKYGSPQAMAPWIEKKWQKIEPDLKLAEPLVALINEEFLFATIGEKEAYSMKDARKLHKNQYTLARYHDLMDVTKANSKEKLKKVGYRPATMLDILKDRVRYLIKRGSTLNNPNVPKSYFADWEEITTDHANRLRQLVRAWLANRPQAHVPL